MPSSENGSKSNPGNTFWPSRPNWTLIVPPEAADLVAKLPRLKNLPLDFMDTLFTPIWSYDPILGLIEYCNKAGLALWDAESVEALQKRDFSAMSETARARLDSIFQRLCKGEEVIEVWHFYPLGKPKTCRTRFSGLMVDDETNGGEKMIFLCEANHMESASADEMLRGAEAVKYVDALIALWKKDGEPLMRNPAAIRLMGSVERALHNGEVLSDYFVNKEEAKLMLASMEKEGWCSGEVQLKPIEGEPVWVAMDLRLTQDPSTGEPTILLHAKDLTERRRVELELIQAREEAEAATKAKSFFLASISHEMRSPAAAIKAGMELLRATTKLDEEQMALLSRMYESTELLTTILNDVLEFSKLGSGNYTTESIAFDVHQAIRTVSDLLLPKAQAKGLTMTCDIGPEVPIGIVTDPTRLRQVLFNLIGNSTKFTEQGFIHVRCNVVQIDPEELPPNGTTFVRGQEKLPKEKPGHPSYLKIEVQDSGIGMNAEQMTKLFKSFSQADESTTRRFGGTGLGLAITHALVEILGAAGGGKGSLSVSSELNIGSTFTIYLPLVPVEEEDDQDCNVPHLLDTFDDGEHTRRLSAEESAKSKSFAQTLTQVDTLPDVAPTNGTLNRSFKEMLIQDPSIASPLHPIPSKPKKTLRTFGSEQKMITAEGALNPPVKVLLVEDNHVLQLIVSKMLRKLGHWVNVASDGLEAIAAMERGYHDEGDGPTDDPTYDVILMDRSMPKCDGPTASKAIRAMPTREAKTPIIVLTADVMAETDDAFGSDVEDYCTKPIDFTKLNDRIIYHVTKWRTFSP